jgi:TonB family protein
VEAFARGDNVVQGYVIVDEITYQALSSVGGIDFDDYNGAWGRVLVDWIGLHVLSHEGHVLMRGPRPLQSVAPRTPDGLSGDMKQDGVTEVSCEIHVVIDGEGKVEDAYVGVPSGYESADRAALEAAGKQEYPPASEDRRPVPCDAIVQYRFSSGP